MKVVIFFLFPLLLRALQSDIYRLVLLPQQRGASCLDGSPPGFYINPGSAPNSNKFLVYFTGGGFCGSGSLADTLQSCYKRSSTNLGSTLKYKAETKFNIEGLLSPNKSINPVFYDWTKIYVIYCDGSEYLGHRESPIQYKGKDLYFRGSRNVLQHFRYFDQKYDFYNGESIVVTGVSAGGMAAYQWSNYLYQNTKKARVLAIPDSGFFITDYYSVVAQQKIIRTQAINLLTLINNYDQLPDPIQKCLNKQKQKLDIVDCLNSANYIQFLKAPLFIIESAYDQWSILNILAVKCYTNQKYPYSLAECNDQYRKIIQDYRQASIQYLYSMKTKAPNISLWSPSCVQHGFSHSLSFYDDRYEVNGKKLAESINQFIRDPSISQWLIDKEGWPSNTGCSGLSSLRFQQK